MLPIDPDDRWGTKPRHHVHGTLDGLRWRGALEQIGDTWSAHLGPAACPELESGQTVEVVLAPEGPQRADLADDLAAALDADPVAGAFFDGLAQFYRRAYLRHIDATTRAPEKRAARIAEVVDLLHRGAKERPRRP